MKPKLLYSYLFCFLCLCFIICIIIIFCLSTTDKSPPRILDKSVTDRILVGDLVLREGNSSQSQVISHFSGSPYSHIGIITSVGDVTNVTHASNDEETNEAVSETTLNEFLSEDHALSARIIRLNNLTVDVREKIASKKKVVSIQELLYEVGLQVEDENSFVATAARNDVPIFAPGLIDSMMGLQLWIFSQVQELELLHHVYFLLRQQFEL